MVGMEVYSSIVTIITIFLGGGWFVHYRAHKRQEIAKARQEEELANQQKADAFKSMQDAYQQTLDDVNKTLAEVRSDRDRYREQRDKAYKDNEEMREKYKDIEERMTQMDIKYRKDISRLGRRIDVLSPFLCGRPGCMDRTKVCLMDDGMDGNYSSQDNNNNENKNN